VIDKLGGYVPVLFMISGFLSLVGSGLVIQTVQNRMRRSGVRLPRAISVLGLFRQMSQYSKLAVREGWSPLLGWIPFPLQIAAVVLFFRGIYLVKVLRPH